MTDREAWEWYIRPGLERARRLDAGKGNEPALAREPATDEEALAYLKKIGVVGVPAGPGAK